MKKRLLVIDSHALIHRAFHALPVLSTKTGEPVNAVYGFLLALLKAIREFEPDFVCACFDLPEPTFRHKQFADYKATRPKAPNELVSQIPRVKAVLVGFEIPIFEKSGFEADDLIATIARKVTRGTKVAERTRETKVEVVILTGDLDLLQIVDENVKVCVFKRGVKETTLYDPVAVEKRFGFRPAFLPDYKALVGDVSDNLPGVPGIGPKTASGLLQQFGFLEKIYERLKKTTGIKPRIKEVLKQYQKQALFSKKLAQVDNRVVIDFELRQCRFKNNGDYRYNKESMKEVLKSFEFFSLINRLPGGESRGNKEAEQRRTGQLL